MKLTVETAQGNILTFEGEPLELAEVAAKLASQDGKASQSMENQRAPAKRYWNEQSARRFWAMLWGEQAKLVKFLVSKGTATYEEVQKFMGYGQQNLSGVLSGITRNAQAATGDRLARLIDWKFTDDGERRYFVDSDAHPFLKQVVK